MNRPITLCSTLLLLFLSICVKAQNLVYNGNFEQYTTCPINGSDLLNCTGWRDYHSGNCEFLTPCGAIPVTVPLNVRGYQYAVSGNSYIGLTTYYNGYYKEFAMRRMMSMVIGLKYRIGISANLANISNYSTNDLGVWFYENGPDSTVGSLYGPLGITPQVSYTSYGAVTDTQNWIRLEKDIIADSAYDHVVVGGFGDANTTYENQIWYSATFETAFYFIDSVTVIPVTHITNPKCDSVYCAGDTLSIAFYTDTLHFSASNNFIVQLSDTSGSFLSNTSLGQKAGKEGGIVKVVIPSNILPGSKYKLRILATSQADSIVVDHNISIGNVSVAKPTASSNSPLCAGDTLKMNAFSTTTGVTYNWKSANVYTTTGASIYIYPATALHTGQYIATASLNGCHSSDTINVTVKPQAVFTPSFNTPLCQLDTLKLSATNYTGASYSWSGPNSFSDTVQNPNRPMISFADTGYYVGTSVLNGCIYKDSIKVAIKPLPQNFSIVSNNPQCQGNTLSMNGSTTSSGVTWAWSGPGSYSSTSSNISFANAQPSISGNYILAATLNGCMARDTLAARVIAIPAVPNPTANTPVCVGQTLNLNAGSTGPAYLWSGPNSFVSTSQTPAINNATTAVAGTYSVKAIDGGCISADGSVTVTVIPAPTAGMYPSPKDSICQGSPVTFNGFASNAGSGYTFRWFRNSLPIPGATGTQYTDTHTADYDSYYCTVTSNGTCATPYTDTGNVVTMRVFPWLVPSVTITTTATGNEVGGDLISFTATPVNGGNYPGYQWKRNNKNELGALSYTWGARTLSDKDVVCVEMTSSYLCPQPKTAMSNCITVTVNTTGIENAEWVNGVRIYPNPVMDELRVEGITAGTEIRIIDILGREMGRMVAGTKTETIATTTWSSGTYLLQLNGKDGKRMTATIVKQ